jgi:hypothetical protein
MEMLKVTKTRTVRKIQRVARMREMSMKKVKKKKTMNLQPNQVVRRLKNLRLDLRLEMCARRTRPVEPVRQRKRN